MTDPIRETLTSAIATLTQQIDSLQARRLKAEAALAAYERSDVETPARGPSQRFVGMTPFDAIKILLREHGGRMKRRDLMDMLIAGGATYGKKRGHHNLRISIETNEKLGKLHVDNDEIGLAEESQATAV